MTKPSAPYVRGALDYDPATGEFVWKYRRDMGSHWNDRWAGTSAGCSRPDGYRVVNVNSRLIRAHHLAYVWMTGSWPMAEVDYIDHNPKNNAWANLRLATRKEQSRNVRCHKDNSTGYKGVFFRKERQKFSAMIYIGGKNKRLGTFTTAEEAHRAYEAAAIRYFGDFACAG